MDTSALLAVILGEPSRAALIAVTRGTSLVGAPSLPWEIGNALVAGVRRRRLSADMVQVAWTSYRSVPIRLVDVDTARALELAVRHNIYAYDAYVLEAARREAMPVLTLDRGLARVARLAGIRLVEWES